MQIEFSKCNVLHCMPSVNVSKRACIFVKSICSTGDICDIKWRMNVAALIDNRLISHRQLHVVVTFNHDTFYSNRFYFFTVPSYDLLMVRCRAFPLLFYFILFNFSFANRDFFFIYFLTTHIQFPSSIWKGIKSETMIAIWFSETSI